jgi:hypothetical protein
VPYEPFRRVVRGFYAWLGSLVFAGITPILAVRLIETGTPAGRITGAMLGVLSWIPLAFVIAAIIRAADEFWFRIHLMALALSFGSALLLLAVADWLVRARFIGRPPLQALWLGAAILWVVWLLIVRRRFEREA